MSDGDTKPQKAPAKAHHFGLTLGSEQREKSNLLIQQALAAAAAGTYRRVTRTKSPGSGLVLFLGALAVAPSALQSLRGR